MAGSLWNAGRGRAPPDPPPKAGRLRADDRSSFPSTTSPASPRDAPRPRRAARMPRRPGRAPAAPRASWPGTRRVCRRHAVVHGLHHLARAWRSNGTNSGAGASGAWRSAAGGGRSVRARADVFDAEGLYREVPAQGADPGRHQQGLGHADLAAQRTPGEGPDGQRSVLRQAGRSTARVPAPRAGRPTAPPPGWWRRPRSSRCRTAACPAPQPPNGARCRARRCRRRRTESTRPPWRCG